MKKSKFRLVFSSLLFRLVFSSLLIRLVFLLSLSFSVFFVSLCLSLSLSVSLCLSPCDVVCAVWRVWCGTLENPRVSVQNVPVCTGTTPACGNTCGRGAGTHGDVLNPHTGGKVSSPVLLTRICPRGFRGSPRKPLDLTHFQFENRLRTTCSRFLQPFALPGTAVRLQLSWGTLRRESATGWFDLSFATETQVSRTICTSDTFHDVDPSGDAHGTNWLETFGISDKSTDWMIRTCTQTWTDTHHDTPSSLPSSLPPMTAFHFTTTVCCVCTDLPLWFWISSPSLCLFRVDIPWWPSKLVETNLMFSFPLGHGSGSAQNIAVIASEIHSRNSGICFCNGN